MPPEPTLPGPPALTRRGLLAAGAAIPLAALVGRLDVAAAASPAPRLAAIAGTSAFRALAPTRLADTRRPEETGYDPFGFDRLDAGTIRVQVTGRGTVPAAAAAAVLNVTATNAGGPGWVKVVPTGSAPAEVSNINVEGPGQILANLVTVQLPPTGQVDVVCNNPLDLVVDVAGVYVPTSVAVAAGRFVGLDQAFRVLDTRERPGRAPVPGGTSQRVDVSQVVPAGASAVVVNLTVTESNGPGFWTAYVPDSPVPTASNVNTDLPNQTRANQAILPIVGTRAIDVFSQTGGHLVVDVAGYFTGATWAAGTDGLFVPSAPVRRLDTRWPGSYGRMYPGWVCEANFTGMSQAQAAVINLTTTETRGPGWFAAYAARTDRPDPASNLNATKARQTIANHAIARTSTAGIAVYTMAGGDVIIDVAGYFTGSPLPATRPPVQNVVPPPSPLPYTIEIPALGISGTVVEGVGDNVVDAGYVGHWPGTGLAGDDDNHMVLFAHRTEHGGIFRNLHVLGAGAQVVLHGADGRAFVYTYTGRQLTGPAAADIYNAGLGGPQPSLSLVACTRTNFQPTDTRYRIVVNFSQV